MSDDLAARLRADFENDPNSNAGEAAARIEELTAERDALAGIVRRYRDRRAQWQTNEWEIDPDDGRASPTHWIHRHHPMGHITQKEPMTPAEQAVLARLAEREEPSDG